MTTDLPTYSLTYLLKPTGTDSGDIVDGKIKLILGLMWTLIQHYSIAQLTSQMTSSQHRRRDDVTPAADDADDVTKQSSSSSKLSPKKQLLAWINEQITDDDRRVTNFTTDWKDGKTLAALVHSVAPGHY